jgi:hypothetical protein
VPDSLGPVPIPDPPLIADFPLRPDYGGGQEIGSRVVTHLMDQPGLKTEQRIFMGDGARRFRVRKARLACREYDDLKAHWTSAYGTYAEFHYDHPVSRTAVERVRVRYADQTLSIDHQAGLLGTVGLVLAEVPQASPTVTVSSIEERFPDTAEASMLLSQQQFLTPLVTITPRGGGAPLYLSDRRVTLNQPNNPPNTQLFLARLTEWSGISQSIGENSDEARFSFGNADEVWYEYSKQVDLFRAVVRFDVLMAASATATAARRIFLWQGHLRSQGFNDNGTFSIGASDGVWELNLAYPARVISRTCWKRFRDGVWCPYEGPETFCDKSVQDCRERGMERYFGGMIMNQGAFRIKHGTTGVDGFGRSGITSVTVRSDTVYERPLQEVYTDKSMPVVCDVAGGRDEDDYYAAVGIVGEGPISAFDGMMKQLLDQQPPHDPPRGGGWLDVHQYPWNTRPAGSSYAAGIAFADIRRTDPEGLQLKSITDREMTVSVREGIGGWRWTAPGARTWAWPLSNPVWIMVNMLLKALGLKADPHQHEGLITVAEQEKYFDVQEAIACAAICDTLVPSMINAAIQEKQYTFRAVLKEQKPLREWLQEVANTFLGFYTFNCGKMRIGVRFHSGVLHAFTQAHIIHRSLETTPVAPRFNSFTVQFGDEEFDWQLNSIHTYDIGHALFQGSQIAPLFTRSQMSLVGVSGKSQASRICATRLREELGGITRKQQQDARNVRFRTSILSLAVYPGDICSIDHPRLPNDRVEFRVGQWRLNPDWSIEITGISTCDDIYNLTIGPKPSDVPAEPLPAEKFPAARGLAWLPNEETAEAGDPLYGPTDRTFALWQDYTVESEGTYSPSIVVRGERTVNQFLPLKAPVIHGIDYTATGGSLKGGYTYYFAVQQRDAAGHLAPLSNIAAIWIPAGSDANIVELWPVKPTEDLPGHVIWMGTDPRRLVEQANEAAVPLGDLIQVSGIAATRTRGAGSVSARKVRIKCKEIEHSGVAGLQVQQVIGNNQIVSSEFIGSPPEDNWVGQILSVVADADDGAVPLWNFRITAFDPATGKLTVDPPCVRGTAADSVQVDDVMIVRSRATAATETSITNTLWNNSVAEAQWGAADGLIPDAEIELLVRIIAGKGAGQVRRCVDNDNVTHWVDPPWTVIPDTTSVYIIEYPDWVHDAESTDTGVPLVNQDVEIGVKVNNLTGNVALVAGFLLDEEGNETPEELAVCREIYLFGQPYEVRRTQGAAGNTSLVDQTLRVDTSAGDVTVDLKVLDATGRALGSGGYFGRTILVVNDGVGAGAGQVKVKPLAGDQFSTGEAEVIIDKPGDWAEFVAAGDPAKITGRQAPLWNRAGRRALMHPATPQRRGRTALRKDG